MHIPTDREIESRLVHIISDGFNRSIGALIEAGAIDATALRKRYKGVGSEFYDLVTAEIQLTARSGVSSVRQLFANNETDRNR